MTPSTNTGDVPAVGSGASGSAFVDIHIAAWKCLYELGDYPCRRDEMTERERKLATMVESLVATMQCIEGWTIREDNTVRDLQRAVRYLARECDPAANGFFDEFPHLRELVSPNVKDQPREL